MFSSFVRWANAKLEVEQNTVPPTSPQAMKLTSSGAISIVVSLGAVALLLMFILFGYEENPASTGSNDPTFSGEADRPAALADLSGIACEHIDEVPPDFLGGWVLGHWSAVILYGTDQDLRKHRAFLSGVTPRLAAARVRYSCLATPRASIGEASLKALRLEVRRP